MDAVEPKTFTSSRGAKLQLRPVSQFKLDMLRTSRIEIPVPTYEMQVAGGESLNYPMDAEIAKNKNRLDEWNAYLAKKQKADAEFSKKFAELLIWEGVDIEVPNGDSEWHKSNVHFGITIPDNPFEAKAQYIYSEFLGTQEDIGNLIAEILSVSQMDEEAVGKLRNSFRAALSRKTDSRLPKKQRKVESQQDV